LPLLGKATAQFDELSFIVAKAAAQLRDPLASPIASMGIQLEHALIL